MDSRHLFVLLLVVVACSSQDEHPNEHPVLLGPEPIDPGYHNCVNDCVAKRLDADRASCENRCISKLPMP